MVIHPARRVWTVSDALWRILGSTCGQVRAQALGFIGGYARALASGFFASIAMLTAFCGAFATSFALASLPLPEPWPGWFAALTHNALIDATRVNVYAATAIFSLGGLLWSCVYVAVRSRLQGPPWWTGVQFSLIPWLVSLAIFLPLVGGGFMGLGLGAGPLPIIGNLVLHVIYGGLLGLLAGPFGDRRVDGEPGMVSGDDAEFQRASEGGAALGLLIGLGLGALSGGAFFIGASLLNVPAASGYPPSGMVVLSALMCGALGLVIGSLIGFSAPRDATAAGDGRPESAAGDAERNP